jgi:hypothetical protein
VFFFFEVASSEKKKNFIQYICEFVSFVCARAKPGGKKKKKLRTQLNEVCCLLLDLFVVV